MIFSKPTKYGAGIEIYGDYQDLNSLRQTILDMSESPALLNDGADEFVLGLAYEVRHAYEGARGTSSVSLPGMPPTTYFHFKTLWPIFLMQVALLRWSAAYQPTNKEHQANLYRLEASTDESLRSFDPFIARRCSEWLASFQGIRQGYLFQFITECAYEYVRGKVTGKARFKKLPETLRKLIPLSEEYRSFEEELRKIAEEKGCQPRDLDNRRRWPKFKW
jgi:hypothetical protein